MFYFQGQISVYKMCLPNKLAEIDKCFILFMFIICSTQCSYWCVCLPNKSCTIINKNSKNAAKVWNYTNHPTAKKRPWRWTEYWIFQRKIMCLWVCVTWWNDCHRKLNLTLKEMSNNEKNHHKFSRYKGTVPLYKGIFSLNL